MIYTFEKKVQNNNFNLQTKTTYLPSDTKQPIATPSDED